jgi:hypothetical protein
MMGYWDTGMMGYWDDGINTVRERRLWNTGSSCFGFQLYLRAASASSGFVFAFSFRLSAFGYLVLLIQD